MRLTHSSSALVRAFQISNRRLFLIVEGLLDRAFYSRLIASHPDLNSDLIQIRLAQEIDPNLGNGKTAILNLYRHMRRNHKLMPNFGGIKKAVAFMLDKDVDDLRHCLCRSPHVIYTEWYGVENYLFRHGDLRLALINGALLDASSIGTFPASIDWTHQCATEWTDWIAFCYIAVKRDVGIGNFGANCSLFHNGPRSNINLVKKAAIETACCSRTGMPPANLAAEIADAVRIVQRLLVRYDHDKIFNGKWYLYFLATDATRVAAGRQLPSDLVERLEAALFASLNFADHWAETLKNKLLSLRATLN